MPLITTIKHWLPFVTFCPVNKLPDLIYISVEFECGADDFPELYAVRREIAAAVRSQRYDFMENIALRVKGRLPKARRVTLRLLFDRHTIVI